MTNIEVFQQVLDQINWIKNVISKRGWELKKDIAFERPATLLELTEVENQLGFSLPGEYRELFLSCAKSLEFRYQFKEEPPEEFSGIFSGEIYWDLDRLPQMFEDYLGWVEGSLMEDSNDPRAIRITKKNWQKKVPFMEVGNGDIVIVGYSPSEVMYFSHEGDDMHGKILGKSLFEFLEFHSRVGFIGSEDWQFEPFYNFKIDRMETTGAKVDRFIQWLNK